MPPTPSAKRAACVACTRAKRKCTKEAPECSRCADRGIPCRYPAPRVTPPYELIFSKDGAVSKINTTVRESNHSAEDDTPSQTQPTNPKRCPTDGSRPWFLSPASWTVEHPYTLPQRLSFSEESLDYYINQLRIWLKTWTSEGHCPLFHGRLHVGNELPDNVQDAYTALAAYQNKTEHTGALVMRIVNRRAQKLVEDQPPVVDDLDVLLHDTATHLARTQSLLIYKVIQLFDGDIRSRDQAEGHIDILGMWARQLWQSAILDVSSDNSLALSQQETELAGNRLGDAVSPSDSIDKQLRTDGSITATWKAWLFAESIRRTYLAATLTEAVYRMIRQGWAPCPGGITFTGGKGLWNAQSPHAWLTEGRSISLSRIRCLDGERLFSESMPSEVDEFTHVVLVVSYGLDRFQQWAAEKEL